MLREEAVQPATLGLLKRIVKLPELQPSNEPENIYQYTIQNVKVDFVSVKDPFLNPVQIIEEIPFADTKDLIALKLNAVKGRRVKKDFWM